LVCFPVYTSRTPAPDDSPHPPKKRGESQAFPSFINIRLFLLGAGSIALARAFTLATTGSIFLALLLLLLFAFLRAFATAASFLRLLALAFSVSTASTISAAFGFGHNCCDRNSGYEYYDLLHLHFGAPYGWLVNRSLQGVHPSKQKRHMKKK